MNRKHKDLMEENVTQINSGIMVNVDESHVCEKDYVWNPVTCSCENEKYLASIMDDSAITCNEVIESQVEEAKTIPTYFNEKKADCKTQYKTLYFTWIFF